MELSKEDAKVIIIFASIINIIVSVSLFIFLQVLFSWSELVTWDLTSRYTNTVTIFRTEAMLLEYVVVKLIIYSKTAMLSFTLSMIMWTASQISIVYIYVRLK
ncbi:MAG: hypothetical protein ACTSRA_00780 [Promethearchaeota archaeon]